MCTRATVAGLLVVVMLLAPMQAFGAALPSQGAHGSGDAALQTQGDTVGLTLDQVSALRGLNTDATQAFYGAMDMKVFTWQTAAFITGAAIVTVALIAAAT